MPYKNSKKVTEQLFNTVTTQLKRNHKTPDMHRVIAEANGISVSTVKAIRTARTWANFTARKEAKRAKAKLGVRFVPLPQAPEVTPTAPAAEPIVINISQEDMRQVLALVGKVQTLQEDVTDLKQGLRSVRGLLNRMSTWVQRIDESTVKLPWRKK